MLFVGQLKYFSAFKARFHCEDTFIKQKNTWIFMSNTSFLFQKITVEVSIVSKRANEIIKPPSYEKDFSCKDL